MVKALVLQPKEVPPDGINPCDAVSPTAELVVALMVDAEELKLSQGEDLAFLASLLLLWCGYWTGDSLI